MTEQPQPEALRLAVRLEDFALALPAYGFDDRPPKEATAELRRLHADNEAKAEQIAILQLDASRQLSQMLDLKSRIAELEEMLLKECQHSADQKLRANQMTEQHRMQAALNSEARNLLAQSERPALTDEQRREMLDRLGAAAEGLDGDTWDQMVISAAERAHGIGDPT